MHFLRNLITIWVPLIPVIFDEGTNTPPFMDHFLLLDNSNFLLLDNTNLLLL